MLRLLVDENVPRAIVVGLRQREPTLDLVRVQDVGLRQTPDPDLLEWAAQQGRVIVSQDKKTLAVNAWERVANNLPMPGVLLLRRHLTTGEAIEELAIWGAAGDPDDTKNQVFHLPI